MAETAASGAEQAPLDEVMLAMDVVDTLRHREHVIARELHEDEREADLLARLKEIYAAQGIEVPERILKEGVEGLKRSRFVYERPRPSLTIALARVYAARWRWGRIAGLAVVALAVVWGAYTFGYRLPAERRAEAARIEFTETIPAELAGLAGEIDKIAEVDSARERAQALLETGRNAAAAGDRAAATAAVNDLKSLRDTLAQVYEIRIVQGQGEQSGVWRIPDVNQDAQNYYLIVEAVDGNGDLVTLPVKSEEDGTVRDVTRWGQRVSAAAFDRVRRDKGDDGIIQESTIGEKRRGFLEPEFTFPVESGRITEW